MRTTTRIALGIWTLVMVLGPATVALADEYQLATAGEEVATVTPVLEVVVPNVTIEVNELPTLQIEVRPFPLPEDPRPDSDFQALHVAAAPHLEAVSPADGSEPSVNPVGVSGLSSGVATPGDDDHGDIQVRPADISDLRMLSPQDDSGDSVGIRRVPGDSSIPEWFEGMVDEAVADAVSGNASDQPTGDEQVEAAPEPVGGGQQKFGPFESWMYGAFGAATVLIIWILLAVGGALARRRS